MKKILLLAGLLIGTIGLSAQEYYNPHVALKPMPSMTIYKIQMDQTATVVWVRIRNVNQLPPFSLATDQIVLRKTSEAEAYRLVKSENAPFAPKKHTFRHRDEVLEFKLFFPPVPGPVKYLDISEDRDNEQFFLRGIILDKELNNAITRGFRANAKGDYFGSLEAFINAAEYDPYFEFGLAHFNVIWLYAQRKNWAEAIEWYKRFDNRFFYDKDLLKRSLAEAGLLQRLEAGK